MVVLDASAPELRRAGLAGDLVSLEPRGGGGAAAAVDGVPHAAADGFDLFRGESLLAQVGADFDRFAADDVAVAVEDAVDDARVVADPAVGHGGGDHGHLQRRGQHVALADRDVGGLAGGPGFARTVGPEPFGAGEDAGCFPGEREAAFLAEPEQLSDPGDLVDSGRVAVLVEEGVAGHAEGGLEVESAVRTALGGDPALHEFAAV